MTAAEVARKAADLLERDGWCQNKRYGESGERCLNAAVDEVSLFCVPDRSFAVKQAVRYHAGTLASEWNDALERTADEVIALLRRIATELEAA